VASAVPKNDGIIGVSPDDQPAAVDGSVVRAGRLSGSLRPPSERG
jgi:hypothetical protein